MMEIAFSDIVRLIRKRKYMYVLITLEYIKLQNMTQNVIKTNFAKISIFIIDLHIITKF